MFYELVSPLLLVAILFVLRIAVMALSTGNFRINRHIRRNHTISARRR